MLSSTGLGEVNATQPIGLLILLSNFVYIIYGVVKRPRSTLCSWPCYEGNMDVIKKCIFNQKYFLTLCNEELKKLRLIVENRKALKR